MILNIKIKFCFNLKYILINYFNEIIILILSNQKEI